MSKEFITWQQAATKLNKSTGNTRTEWPTKSQLVTFGADSAKLQKYTAAEFVAEEDVSATASAEYIRVTPTGSSNGFIFTDEGIVSKKPTYQMANSKFPSMADPTGIRLTFRVAPPASMEGNLIATCPDRIGVKVTQIRLTPPELAVTFDLENIRPGSMHNFVILLEDGSYSTVIRFMILVVA